MKNRLSVRRLEWRQYMGSILTLTIMCMSSAPVWAQIPGVRKVKDMVIYSDSSYFSSFPSAIVRPDGELWVAFRRAPDRRLWGASTNAHVDPNSYLMMVRSSDGEHWTPTPELICAHPLGGSQDPCLLQLSDNTVLCASYLWTFLREQEIEHLRKPYIAAQYGAIFQGGYFVRTEDGGKSWSKPFYPMAVPGNKWYAASGGKLPAYNRGALCEARDGRILWATPVTDSTSTRSVVHLLQSRDKGYTWEHVSVIAQSDRASFNETSLYETPAGDIVAFLRTAGYDDQACIARSRDGGETFEWESMGFQGHPINVLCLPDQRVLMTYGYRHAPYGIRMRILDAECRNYATAPEMVLRDDGGGFDLGYTWPVPLGGNRYLIVYYFNTDGPKGVRYIAGTIIEID